MSCCHSYSLLLNDNYTVLNADIYLTVIIIKNDITAIMKIVPYINTAVMKIVIIIIIIIIIYCLRCQLHKMIYDTLSQIVPYISTAVMKIVPYISTAVMKIVPYISTAVMKIVPYISTAVVKYCVITIKNITTTIKSRKSTKAMKTMQ